MHLKNNIPLVQLHILTVDFQDNIYSIKEPGTYRIGRDPKCEVHVNDDEVSRVHAQLLWNGNVMTIEDLCSTNGIYLNGEKIVCHRLTTGDIVAFGSSVFRVEIVDKTEPAAG